MDWEQTTVYFGMDMPAGGTVSEAQFAQFVQDVVTKEFPEGLTAFDAYGQMEHADGSIERQPTKALLLVHEKSSAGSEAVGRIIESYRSSFGAPQVMRTTAPIEVEFFQSGPASP